jgi:hypothetical protein
MRLPRKLSGLLAAAMMAAGLTVAAAPARASTPAPYFQMLTLAGAVTPPLCMQGDTGGPSGTFVSQQYCDTTGTNPYQQWLPISLGGDQYKFENVAIGRCLEALNGAVNGGAVDLWPCSSGESNERWQWPTPSGQAPFPNIWPIQTRVSGTTGYCLDVPGASNAGGVPMQVYRCNRTIAQGFFITQFE